MKEMKNALPALTMSLIILITASSPLAAQSEPVRLVADNRRTISVRGEAELRVKPDEIRFEFAIEKLGTSVTDLTHATAGSVDGFLRFIASIGIDSTLAVVGDPVITPRFGLLNGVNIPVDYAVKRIVIVRVGDMDRVAALLHDAADHGAVVVGQGVYRSSKLAEHREEARAQAARAARLKAEALAEVLGVRAGTPISITEEIYDKYGNPISTVKPIDIRGQEGADVSSEAGGVPGLLAVHAAVEVVFELIE